MTASKHNWDAFISYASEDRAEVEFLAKLLSSFDLRIWFDQTELRVGDSLRARMDDGLANCQYGIVILSPHFFTKQFPEWELSGLLQREVDRTNVILPVWKDVTATDVRKYSPPLADRIAAKWDDGEITVLIQLLEVLRPETDLKRAFEEYGKLMVDLDHVTSGEQLMALIKDSHGTQLVHDEFSTKEEADCIGDFFQDLRDLAEIIGHLEPIEFAREEFRLTQAIAQLSTAGWKVFAVNNWWNVGTGTHKSRLLVSSVAILRVERERATVFENAFIIQNR